MPFKTGNQYGVGNRFQAGQSGNPAGYPTGVPNRGTLLRKFLDAPIDYKDLSTGEVVRGTMEEAIDMALIVKAIQGDVAAFRAIMDCVYGKQTTQSSVSIPTKTIIKIGGRTPPPTQRSNAEV